VRFCPKCGTRLMRVKEEDGEYLACPNPNCGYKAKFEGATLVPVIRSEKSPRDKITVIDKGDELRPFPTVEVECPNCGHTEAEFWSVQTRSSDEGATQFFRCTRCGYTWREYG